MFRSQDRLPPRRRQVRKCLDRFAAESRPQGAAVPKVFHASGESARARMPMPRG